MVVATTQKLLASHHRHKVYWVHIGRDRNKWADWLGRQAHSAGAVVELDALIDERPEEGPTTRELAVCGPPRKPAPALPQLLAHDEEDEAQQQCAGYAVGIR